MASQTHSEPAGDPRPVGKACDTCGSVFASRRAWARFCDSRCRNAFHQAEARVEAIRAAALEMYEALRIIAATSCERLTSGPGSCWSQAGWTREAEFGADRWCQPCTALAAIHDLKPPVEPKALREKASR